MLKLLVKLTILNRIYYIVPVPLLSGFLAVNYRSPIELVSSFVEWWSSLLRFPSPHHSFSFFSQVFSWLSIHLSSKKWFGYHSATIIDHKLITSFIFLFYYLYIILSNLYRSFILSNSPFCWKIQKIISKFIVLESQFQLKKKKILKFSIYNQNFVRYNVYRFRVATNRTRA